MIFSISISISFFAAPSGSRVNVGLLRRELASALRQRQHLQHAGIGAVAHREGAGLLTLPTT
jgi:hypothetical protein